MKLINICMLILFLIVYFVIGIPTFMGLASLLNINCYLFCIDKYDKLNIFIFSAFFSIICTFISVHFLGKKSKKTQLNLSVWLFLIVIIIFLLN